MLPLLEKYFKYDGGALLKEMAANGNYWSPKISKLRFHIDSLMNVAYASGMANNERKNGG